MEYQSFDMLPVFLFPQRTEVKQWYFDIEDDAWWIYLLQAKFVIDYYAVVCSVTWPFLNGSEAGVDLAL